MSFRVLHSDCVEALRAMPEASVDAIVTDPPYELGFMGRRWDSSGIAYSVDLWREALRVLKPGGHLAAFGGTRTYHRMACAIEDAGFEIRDSLHWIYGSGFPKSLDVSKAIDAHLGAERPVVGIAKGAGSANTESLGEFRAEYAATAPATAPATAWDGWGTALKPAHEPIVLARKPLGMTVAACVLQHGTGALNVDGCRVSTDDDLNGGAYSPGDRERGGAAWGNGSGGGVMRGAAGNFSQPSGRWPPNVLMSHDPGCNGTCAPGCPVAELDRQSGEAGGGFGVRGSGPLDGRTSFALPGQGQVVGFGDAGGASRFFPIFRYVAKPARSERDAGLHDLEAKSGGDATDREDGSAGLRSPRAGAGRNGGARNHHPTVKPVELMEWLCRLVTPKGGTVLDPFLGSGTTGMAAVRMGFDFIGIEREAEYVELATRRIALAANAPRSKPVGALERAEAADPRQPSLFGDAA